MRRQDIPDITERAPLQYKGENMKITFLEKSLINPEVTREDNLIYVQKITPKNNYEEIANTLALAHIHRVTFDDYNFLKYLDKEELKELDDSIPEKFGVTLLDIRKEYGLEEFLKTILQYMRDYGNLDIPREIYDTISNYRVVAKPRTIKVLSFTDYANEIKSIANSKKNPTSKELKLLQITQRYIKEAEFGIIPNRNVLYELALRIPMTFVCHTTSGLRRYIEARIDTASSRVPYRTLKTRDKTFVMRTLDGLPKSEVLDDFATNRYFWKCVEKAVIPTKKKYNHFKNAQELFRLLRDNDFKESNNSIIENTKLPLASKFNQMVSLKGANFALRNVTRILKQSDADIKEVESLAHRIEKANPSLKQLFELWRALDYADLDESVVKTRQGFWLRKKEKLPQTPANALFSEIKTIIKNKANSKLFEYAEELKTNKELKEKYEKFPDIEIPNRLLRGIAIPTSTDGFFDIDFSKHYITRGSAFELDRFLNPEEPYSVFVAWKSKDNKEKHQDLDLSCNLVYNYDTAKNTIEFDACNYTHLKVEKDGKEIVKHSGDWTSCVEFDAKNPRVVAELIKINYANAKDIDLNFVLNCFNSVSMKNFDVYVGLIREEDVEYADERAYVNLSKAAFLTKLSNDFIGYLKLFTIRNRSIRFECAPLNTLVGTSSASAAKSSQVCGEYFGPFTSFDMLDFVGDMLDYPKDTHNPYKLNEFMTYILA